MHRENPLTLIMSTQRLHYMIQNGQVSVILTLGLYFAERQGFEPWVPKRHNGFRDRPDRPLRHLSSVVFDSVQNYNFFLI